jgi:hypothetical protein
LCACSSCFFCSSIAALEAQFSTQACVGVHHKTEAHERRWCLSLKYPCFLKTPAEWTSMHPSVDEAHHGVAIMRGPPSDTPNLDDVLARDFAELKIGETKIKSESTPAPQPEKKTESTVPSVYNQRIDAVEDRTSFAVKAPPTKPDKPTAALSSKAPPKVLKSPSAHPGDDFDVEW